jgi:hypothetical protein
LTINASDHIRPGANVTKLFSPLFSLSWAQFYENFFFCNI